MHDPYRDIGPQGNIVVKVSKVAAVCTVFSSLYSDCDRGLDLVLPHCHWNIYIYNTFAKIRYQRMKSHATVRKICGHGHGQRTYRDRDRDRDRFRDWDQYQDQSPSRSWEFLVPMLVSVPVPIISGPNDWSWSRSIFCPVTNPGLDLGPVAWLLKYSY